MLTTMEYAKKAQEQLYIGKTAKLRREGFTPEEIAVELEQPLDDVISWFMLATKGDKRDKSRKI